jgi:hypothetical protein
MAYTVHHNPEFVLDLEQHPVVADTEAVFWHELRKTLHISAQSIRKDLECVCNPRRFFPRDMPQILERPRF